MAWASTDKVVLGCIAFAGFWFLAVFPAVPLLPIGRTAGSVSCACLMVVFQVLSPKQAFAAVDLPILGLLFGTMVVSVYLERADLFKYLGRLLVWKSKGGKDLLCRVCLLSALTSALFTNDTTCVVFTGFLLKLCHQQELPPEPFLMALATSSNIGSAATAIGNPQNLVIAIQSKISFLKFLIGILPAMLVGIVLNTCLLLGFYWKKLENRNKQIDNSNTATVIDIEEAASASQGQGSSHGPMEISASQSSSHGPMVIDELLKLEMKSGELGTGTGYPLNMAHYLRSHSSHQEQQQQQQQSQEQIVAEDGVELGSSTGSTESNKSRAMLKKRLWKSCVYVVTLGMLAALLAGLDLSWTALTAAVALMALGFSDASPCLDQVSYSLLVFFSGMFITVDGFNRTGAPGQFWNAVEPYARVDSVGGVALLSVVVVLLSNVASNVPTVLLLGARVAQSAAGTSGASVTRAWLMLAWVSTVAGNLTLVGSAANLIISEQARRGKPPYRFNFSFWRHLRFGLPSTVLVIAVGLPLIQMN